MEILRYYYPNDIEISETNIITGVLISFPGTQRLGSTGLAVLTIQAYLNRIRQNYPAIPQITDDSGVFGQSTQAAVQKFQSVFGLTADGIVGKDTWNKISYIYVGVTKLAELDSQGTALGIGTVPPNTILRVTSTGVDVITLQYILNFISAFYPTIPETALDGIFGQGTAQSVIAFQRLKELPANGIVNAATWNALYNTYWGIRNNVPIPKPPVAGIDYIVQQGDTLWILAQRFNTTIQEIKNVNNLTSDNLIVGQVLKIPITANTHIVIPGDTLWLLAQRYNTTVDAIKTLNNLTGDVLMIGQRLLIKPR